MVNDTQLKAETHQESNPPSLILGRYRYLQSLAQGGFGTVFSCWDTRLQRRVAIKYLPLYESPTHMGSQTIQEALAEARSSAFLNHPGIVTVFDFELDQNAAYLVMEFVNGISLAELLSRVEGGILTGDECAYLVRSLADALAFAHENGVLHLDIKPSNIMITPKGQIKLCDFGMASLASAAGYEDARGGTLGYMGTEQITGEMVDERSDVFSFAAVIWESLTNTRPFYARSAEESLALIQKGPKKKSSSSSPMLTGNVEDLLLKCLAFDKSERLADVSAIADELILGLGNCAAGKESFINLLEQVVNADEEDGVLIGGEKLPLAFRYPWLSGFFQRGAAALCSALLASQIAPAISSDFMVEAGVIGGSVAFASLLPKWSAVPTMLLLAVAMLLNFELSAAGFVLLLVFVGCVLCLLRSSKDYPLANLGVLLGPCLNFPEAGLFVSAFDFPLKEGLIQFGLSYLFSKMYLALRAGAFSLALAGDAFLGSFTEPGELSFLLISAIVCCLACLIAWHKASVKWDIFSQILCAMAPISAVVVNHSMEIAGVLTSVELERVGFALLLCVIMSIAASIRGDETDFEGEQL